MLTRILQLTDLHLLSEPAGRLRGVPTRDSFRDVLQAVSRNEKELERIVITGDLAHDEQLDTYQQLRELLADWIPRCRLIPGNHDDRAFMRQVFGELIPGESGPVTFSETAGDWRLIGLDSHVKGEVPGRIDADQLEWLSAELSTHADQPTLLFLHHPPIPVGVPWLDRIGLQDPGPLVDLITASPQVRVVSAGHVHHEFSGRIGQAAFYTTPSSALQFRPEGEEPAYLATPPGYRVFELDGERYHTEVVRLPTVDYPPET